MTKTERQAAARLIENLFALQKGLKEDWLRRSLPEGWMAGSLDPVAPKKTRVTLSLDADIVKIFRALGPGYQKRINQILRVYVEAMAAGKIRVEPELSELGPNYLEPLLEIALRTSALEADGAAADPLKGAPGVAGFIEDWIEER